MDRTDIREALIGAARELTDVTVQITDDMLLVDDLGLDSLDLIEIVMNMGPEVNAATERSNFAEVRTFGDAVDHLQRALETAA